MCSCEVNFLSRAVNVSSFILYSMTSNSNLSELRGSFVGRVGLTKAVGRAIVLDGVNDVSRVGVCSLNVVLDREMGPMKLVWFYGKADIKDGILELRECALPFLWRRPNVRQPSAAGIVGGTRSTWRSGRSRYGGRGRRK